MASGRNALAVGLGGILEISHSDIEGIPEDENNGIDAAYANTDEH